LNGLHDITPMPLTRREFLILGASLVAGCSSPPATSPGTKLTDAGPSKNFVRDGVYSQFRSQGFFIVRRGAELIAISSVCTHRKCTVTAQPDRSFYCPCHGSTFDPEGHVTRGPARRHLPLLESFTNQRGHFMVAVPSPG